MKTLATIVFIVTLLIVCNISTAQDIPVIVEYKDGNLPKKLPYGTNFIIKGEPIYPFSKDTADKVIFWIIPEDKSDSTSYVWRKKNTGDKLNIKVDQELYPGKKYQFKFDFYVEQQIQEKAVQEIIDSVKVIAINKFNDDNGSSLSDLDNITRNIITGISRNYPNYYYYDGDKEINKIKFTYTQQWLQIVMNIAMKVRLINLDVDQISQSYKSIKAICDTINKDSVAESEWNCILVIRESENFNELVSGLADLKSCFSNIEPIENELNLFENRVNSITKHQKDIASLEKQLFTLEDQLKKTKQLIVETVSWKSDDNNIKTKSTSIEQLGIRYGIAYTPINFNYSQWFQFVTARFYFFPIDKNMNNPYYNWYNRVSLNVGAVVGDLKYKSQELHNLENLGVKLLTGLSYDVTKQFSLNTGLVWFEYNEGNTFNEIKASVYLGLSFDFNIVENIKK